MCGDVFLPGCSDVGLLTSIFLYRDLYTSLLIRCSVGGAIANQETVRGFALKPDMPGFGESDSYIPINAANALRDPCLESCQRLITQIGVINQQPWNWETSFGVRSIRNQVSPGSGGEPAPPNRAARRAAAAAAAAANSLPAA